MREFEAGVINVEVTPKENINVVIGDVAKMDCEQAINYVKSGAAEIEQAVQEGIGEFDANSINKTTAFNNNYTSKKALIDAAVDLAKQWAIGDPTEPAGYSSKYWANEASSAVSNRANVDLSNLSATGEAKFTAVETSAKNYADSLSVNYATAAQGALADRAVQPADLATVATTGDYDDLLNKPTLPAAQVNSDWNAISGVAQILNKPSLATVATSGSYNDLSGIPDLSFYAKTDLSNLTSTGKSTCAEMSMPSNTYIDETYTSSYTALANGYLYVSGAATSNGGIIALSNTSASFGVQSSGAHSVGYGVYCTIPCKAGDIISVYVATVNVSVFRFIYAQGEI